MFAYRAADLYVAGDDDAALAQVRRARLFPLIADSLNNVGYMYMALGQRDAAEVITRQAAAKAEKEKEYRIAALALYNSAMCAVLGRRREAAVAVLSQSRQMLAADSEGNYELRCLFIPVVDSGALTLKEMWDPELSSAVGAAIGQP